jgi:hypothetical protein
VTSKWAPELERYCPNTPIVLVGTKTDERDEAWSLEFVGNVHAQEIAEQIGAKAYCEVSAKSGKGVKELFDRIVSISMTAEQDSRTKVAKEEEGKYHIYDGAVYKRIMKMDLFTDESTLKDKLVEHEIIAPYTTAKEYLETVETGDKFDNNTKELAAMIFTTFESEQKICIPSYYSKKVSRALSDLVGFTADAVDKIMDDNVCELKTRYFDEEDNVFIFFQHMEDNFTGECNILGIDGVPKHATYELKPVEGIVEFSESYGTRINKLKMKVDVASRGKVTLFTPSGKVYKL